MDYTKGDWKVDVRVGCVAVYQDNEVTRSYQPCIADPEVCIYYKSGKQELNLDGSFKQWNVDPEDVANAHLIAASPRMYEALKVVLESGFKASERQIKLALSKADGE